MGTSRVRTNWRPNPGRTRCKQTRQSFCVEFHHLQQDVILTTPGVGDLVLPLLVARRDAVFTAEVWAKSAYSGLAATSNPTGFGSRTSTINISFPATSRDFMTY